MNLDEMCSAALFRVEKHINAVAGQHLRAMRKRYAPPPTHQQRVVSDELWAMAMSMTCQRVKNVDVLIEGFCELAGVSYPPQQMEAV